MAVVSPPAEGAAAPDPSPATDLAIRGYRPDGRLGHIAPLDGIRGLGIPFVLLYHHGAELAGVRFGGGFLTVSMFFTLSGFLITRLLIDEAHRTDTIDVRRFYARRFRRLMPAALAVLALIALFWAVFPTRGRSLSIGSYLSSLFYSQNLYLRWQGKGYSQIFAERSPLQHMWSLSLEEQIYALFPLVLLLLLAWPRVRRHLAGSLALLAVASYATAALLAGNGTNESAYYATEARAGEFLLGAAFATYWLKGQSTAGVSHWLRTPLAAAISFGVLALEVFLWVTVDLGTSWLFPWGVALNSAVVCVILGYACAGSGTSGLLSIAPLTWLGRLTYGIYLVHWPVFLFLTPDAVDLGSEALFALRVAVTFAITLAIFHLVEDPVRSGRTWSGRRFVEGCVLLGVAGLAVALFARQPSSGNLVDETAVALQANALASLPDLPPDAPTVSALDPSLPARVLVVGDSQAWIVGNGLKDQWSPTSGVHVEPSPGVGCGTTVVTPILYLGEDLDSGQPGCTEWRQALPLILAKFQPQVVLVVGGLADVSDHRIDGEWQHIGEPAYDAWLLAQMQSFADELTAAGSRVLWTTLPDVRLPKGPNVPPFDEEDPARIDRYNELITTIATDDPRVELSDLAAYVQARPGGQFDPEFRPDGAHFDLRAAPDVVTFIADEIRRASAPA